MVSYIRRTNHWHHPDPLNQVGVSAKRGDRGQQRGDEHEQRDGNQRRKSDTFLQVWMYFVFSLLGLVFGVFKRTHGKCSKEIRSLTPHNLARSWRELFKGKGLGLKMFLNYHWLSLIQISIPQSSCWLPCLLRHQLNCEHGGRSPSWGEWVWDGRLWKLGENPISTKEILLIDISIQCSFTRFLVTLQVLTANPALNPDEEGGYRWQISGEEGRNQFQRNDKISCTHKLNPYPLESIMVTFKTWMDHLT